MSILIAMIPENRTDLHALWNKGLNTLDNILLSNDENEVWSIFENYLYKLKLDKNIYAYIEIVNGDLASEATFIRTNMNRQWFSLYKSKQYHKVDSAVKQRLAGFLAPLDIPIDKMSADPDTVPATTLVKNATIASGLTICRNFLLPMQMTENGPRYYTMSLGTSQSEEVFYKIMDTYGEELILLTQHVHQQYQAALKDAPKGNTSCLSGQELKCLQKVSQDQRPQYIADQMGVAKVTVDMHLRNARTKLKVKTNPAAVAKAMTLGLFKP